MSATRTSREDVTRKFSIKEVLLLLLRLRLRGRRRTGRTAAAADAAASWCRNDRAYCAVPTLAVQRETVGDTMLLEKVISASPAFSFTACKQSNRYIHGCGLCCGCAAIGKPRASSDASAESQRQMSNACVQAIAHIADSLLKRIHVSTRALR